MLEKATLALGRIDGLTAALPDPTLYLYSCDVCKEAVLSSQIEGTQSSLSDLLLFEVEGTASVHLDDVQEVSRYVAAMSFGIQSLKELPISLRLIKEIHKALLTKGRGSEHEPGEFRRSQNWVGGTRPGNAIFVPPPPEHIIECRALEKFLHNDRVKTPLLIKAALAHVQFETIHPFLDGNGRLGRLVDHVTVVRGKRVARAVALPQPLFQATPPEILRVASSSSIDRRLGSMAAVFSNRSCRDFESSRAHRKILNDLGCCGRTHPGDQESSRFSSAGASIASAPAHFSLLPMRARNCISAPTVTGSLGQLEKLGIVQEATGRKYRRHFTYAAYRKILNEGTEIGR